MKKTVNLAFLILCAALCGAMVFSCASSGGGASESTGETVPYVGVWEGYTDINDGGNSTINVEETEKDGMTAYRVTGNVTTGFVYGFVGWQVTPDAATLENLKNAKALSFKFIGDGKRETVKYRISSVKDYAHYEYHFFGEAGEETYVEVPIRFFQQPSWGNPVRLNQANAEDICWQTHESWRPGTFEILIWDVKIHL
jgi:hypothetical protein